jgi:hypothetical protein
MLQIVGNRSSRRMPLQKTELCSEVTKQRGLMQMAQENESNFEQSHS